MALTTTATEKTKTNLDFVMKNLLAGGVAGMCSKTTVAPLDRIKILLQAHSKHYKHLGVFTGLKHIVKKESFLALYKGNGAQMVRIFPYAATQFTAFEIYKKFFASIIPANQYIKHSDKFCAGACAGVTAVTLTYPLDTIRARLAFQVTGEHKYTGISHTATEIFRHEGGVRALYRGFVPTLMGMVPYAGFSFYCFEMLKFMCMKYVPQWSCRKCERNTGGLVLLIHAKLLCGGFAGAVAQSISYPLDVTRRRMQLAMMNPETKKFGMGMVKTLQIIYKENGVVRGLYRGMSINYLRAIPMVAVSFSTYELLKQALRLDTGGLVLLIHAKLLCGGFAGAVAQSISYPLDVTRRRMQLAMMNPETKKFGMGMVKTLQIIYKENGVVRGLYRGMSINYLRAIPMVAVSFSTYELLKQALRLDTGMKI